MKFNLAFYVHHHGAGHFTRTAQIIRHLHGFHITLLGSNLKPYQHLLPKETNVIHLPMDTPDQNDVYHSNGNAVDAFHYAPLNIKGISERAAMMTNFFQSAHPLLLVVDVSVEVTLLARLAGIPTIVMRQHGLRDDLPHLMAYQSAELLIAPFPAAISPKSAKWITDKTKYVGGFSRFDKGNSAAEKPRHVAVIVGSGGTSIDADFIGFLTNAAHDFNFYIIGKIDGKAILQPHVTYYGHQDEPGMLLEQCSMVIGNTGHNTVMEMASLNKRFIAIPESRPFDEQLDKARAIQSVPGVIMILPESLYETNWNEVLHQLQAQQPEWDGIIAENALASTAEAIVAVGQKIYG
ncbi:glycosyltransferase [Pedobacter sp. AJM]|uniref:glycosyltransferase n=1 Tax=Pedobacter sp. AJM TaxID=2003629 RepID=UPI000B4B982E|nr:glycosyltransferase [Pedobacter sp. AJM]OWK70249.1 hypothetical protein CBW18_12340 [Pedobacter sp. AJM]